MSSPGFIISPAPAAAPVQPRPNPYEKWVKFLFRLVGIGVLIALGYVLCMADAQSVADTFLDNLRDDNHRVEPVDIEFEDEDTRAHYRPCTGSACAERARLDPPSCGPSRRCEPQRHTCPRNHPRPCYTMVRHGDTLSDLAQRYNVPQWYLIQVNGLANPNRLHVNQVIWLDVPGCPPREWGTC